MKLLSGHIFYAAILSLSICASCSSASGDSASTDFVTVKDGRFYLHGQPYEYIGANMWYASILASTGEGGDARRLESELDMLKSIGVDNLRVLVGAEGSRPELDHIEPALQTSPGVYNDTLLAGLDNLLVQLEKRDMRAVLYLGNTWEWSGGFGTYLEWSGRGEAPVPSRDSYQTFTKYVCEFSTDSLAKKMYADNVAFIVGRVNSLTGKPYALSPAIMSWQIANEPRCFDDSKKAPFEQWIYDTARLIKSIDPNHLVSTGSEGSFGCQVDIDMWARIHNSDLIDYATIHIWPYNWRWTSARDLGDSGLENSLAETRQYIAGHRALTSKPLVIEEFGYPRDSMSVSPGSPTVSRDSYYEYVLSQVANDSIVNGINFWGWGGSVNPPHTVWQPGDPYTCDPAHESQGLYSVFAADSSTVDILEKAVKRLKNKR